MLTNLRCYNHTHSDIANLQKKQNNMQDELDDLSYQKKKKKKAIFNSNLKMSSTGISNITFHKMEAHQLIITEKNASSEKVCDPTMAFSWLQYECHLSGETKVI